jgi:UDP-glucuronate 4-epimerase
MGDVHDTFADIEDFRRDYNFTPKVSFEDGMSSFIDWYKNYYN